MGHDVVIIGILSLSSSYPADVILLGFYFLSSSAVTLLCFSPGRTVIKSPTCTKPWPLAAIPVCCFWCGRWWSSLSETVVFQFNCISESWTAVLLIEKIDGVVAFPGLDVVPLGCTSESSKVESISASGVAHSDTFFLCSSSVGRFEMMNINGLVYSIRK